jgi:hypothetical protein
MAEFRDDDSAILETFSIEPMSATLGGSTYFLRNLFSGLYLQVPNSGADTPYCTQWSFNNLQNFQWDLVSLGGNEFRIQPSYNTNLLLGVAGNSSGLQVRVETGNITNPIARQRWRIVQNHNGTFQITSVSSNLVLRTSNANNGGAVTQGSAGTRHGDWILEPANPAVTLNYQTQVGPSGQNLNGVGRFFESVSMGDVGGVTGSNFGMRNFRVTQLNIPGFPNSALEYRVRFSGQTNWTSWVNHRNSNDNNWVTLQNNTQNIVGIEVRLNNATGWNVFTRVSAGASWTPWSPIFQLTSSPIEAIQVVVVQGNTPTGTRYDALANQFRAIEAYGFMARHIMYWDNGFNSRAGSAANRNERLDYYRGGVQTVLARYRIHAQELDRRQWSSLADRCPTSSFNTQCTCVNSRDSAGQCRSGTNCNARCKNHDRNVVDVQFPLHNFGSSSVASTGFTGHRNCRWTDENDNKVYRCRENRPQGVAASPRNGGHRSLTWDRATQNEWRDANPNSVPTRMLRREYRRVVAIHEFLHSMRVTSNEGMHCNSGDICLMANNSYNLLIPVLEQMPVCCSCRLDIILNRRIFS